VNGPVAQYQTKGSRRISRSERGQQTLTPPTASCQVLKRSGPLHWSIAHRGRSLDGATHLTDDANGRAYVFSSRICKPHATCHRPRHVSHGAERVAQGKRLRPANACEDYATTRRCRQSVSAFTNARLISEHQSPASRPCLAPISAETSRPGFSR
jgi:hypothetical protein